MSSLRNSYREIAGRPVPTIVRYLTDDGTGITGNRNITGDYSVTPQDFWIAPPTTQKWIVERIGGVINGINNAELNDYGVIPGGLVNGLKFFLGIGLIEIDITASSNHKANADLLANGNVHETLDYVGQNKIDQFYLPTVAGTDTIVLDGARAMKLIMRANDNFTLLERHTFFVHFRNLGQKEA